MSPSYGYATEVRHCENCDTEMNVTVERIRYASDQTTEIWDCNTCGESHRDEFSEGEN